MYRKYGKRVIDIICSALGLCVLAIPMGVVSFMIRIKLGSPVLFRQKRIGKNNREFTLLKFRTMVDSHDEEGKLLSDEERLTPFGAVLRKLSIDELPSLINILKGDMSFVGPRPLLVQYLPYYRENEKRRHSVRPGLTGLAQVNGRNALSWTERFQMDVSYVDHLSFSSDIKIFAKTFEVVWKRSDILMGKEHIMQNLDDERRVEYTQRDSLQ